MAIPQHWLPLDGHDLDHYKCISLMQPPERNEEVTFCKPIPGENILDGHLAATDHMRVPGSVDVVEQTMHATSAKLAINKLMGVLLVTRSCNEEASSGSCCVKRVERLVAFSQLPRAANVEPTPSSRGAGGGGGGEEGGEEILQLTKSRHEEASSGRCCVKRVRRLVAFS